MLSAEIFTQHALKKNLLIPVAFKMCNGIPRGKVLNDLCMLILFVCVEV